MKGDPVEFALVRLIDAIGVIEDLGADYEEYADGLREVADQLTGWCSPAMRLTTAPSKTALPEVSSVMGGD